MIWFVVAVPLIVVGIILLAFDRSRHPMSQEVREDGEGDPDLFQPLR